MTERPKDKVSLGLFVCPEKRPGVHHMAENPVAPPAAPGASPELAAATVQMEQARVAATEQARVADETGIDPSLNQRPASPAASADSSREPSLEDQAGDGDGTAPEAGTDPLAPPDPNKPSEQKWSRTDAPRLAAKVEELSKALEEHRGKLGDRDRTDMAALGQFAGLIKTPDEYRELEIRARNGDWEAKQSLEVADAWRQMAAPVFALAQRQADQYVGQVEQAYKADMHKLTTLDGVDDTVMQKVSASRSPGETLRVLYEAGRTAEKSEAKGKIAALETEVGDLRRRLLAGGAQPLGSNGSAGAPGSLANLVRSDGLLDEATIQRALNGEFVGFGVERPAR